MEIVLIVAQVILGLYFITAGINHFTGLQAMTDYAAGKGLPAPKAGTIVSGLGLFAGGLGILFGVLVFWALWGMVAFLVLVSLTLHRFWKAAPEEKMNELISFRSNIALAAALTVLTAFVGSWPWSIM